MSICLGVQFSLFFNYCNHISKGFRTNFGFTILVHNSSEQCIGRKYEKKSFLTKLRGTEVSTKKKLFFIIILIKTILKKTMYKNFFWGVFVINHDVLFDYIWNGLLEKTNKKKTFENKNLTMKNVRRRERENSLHTLDKNILRINRIVNYKLKFIKI